VNEKMGPSRFVIIIFHTCQSSFPSPLRNNDITASRESYYRDNESFDFIMPRSERITTFVLLRN